MRNFIRIRGSEKWCCLKVTELFPSYLCQKKTIIYCGSNPQTLTAQQINVDSSSKRSEIEQYLGTESSVLIINCFTGFNPDLFCALCGTVQSPGFIVLLSPSDEDWLTYPDPDYKKMCSFPFSESEIKGRFIRYFLEKLTDYEQSDWLFVISENDKTNIKHKQIKATTQQLLKQENSNDKKIYHTDNNHKQVIYWVTKTLNSTGPGLLIIGGKRGRGKTSVIGLALKAFADQSGSETNVCLTSQTKLNIQPILKQLSTKPISDIANPLCYKSLSLSYIPPDILLKSTRNPDLLIIDEAAAIPLPQLYEMLNTYPRVILSSTTDGYEGTGMGFRSKLTKWLDNYSQPQTYIELTRPLRWPGNDPVEQFLVNGLLPDYTDSININYPITQFKIDELKIEKLDRDELIKNINLIDQIYTLLSKSHYRTTPDDLRFILDAPGIELWIASYNGNICATLMSGNEGGIPEQFHDDIWLGRRRLHGHLIAQSLAVQCGFKSAGTYLYKRILRIAVTDCLRNRGIGTKLVNTAMSHSDQCLDFCGVSFGHEKQVFDFWKNLAFNPVKTGYRLNARSGLRSIIMLHPLSDRGCDLMNQLSQRYICEVKSVIGKSLAGSLSYPHNSWRIIHQATLECEQDKLDVYSFAFGYRQLAHCQWVLSKYANLSLNCDEMRSKLSAEQISLLTLNVMQNYSIDHSTKLLKVKGKKQTIRNLRQVFALIYNFVWGNKS